MRRYIGALVFALLVIVTFVPLGLQAEPTRGAIASLSEVGLDGFKSMDGAYAPGEHKVTVTLMNSGEDALAATQLEFTVIIDHPNGTNFANFTQKEDIILWPDSSVDKELGLVDFPAGEYNVSVNITFEGASVGAYSVVDIQEVIDLSFLTVSFEDGAEYPLGAAIIPGCEVLYDGNIGGWTDDVSLSLEIVGTDYSSEVVISYAIGGEPIDPGFVFDDVSFLAWTPTVSGEYEARFTIAFIDYELTNNYLSVPFTVAKPAAIAGNVTSDDIPVSGVLVSVISGVVPVTTNATDVNGYFEIYGLDAGTYTLEFSYRWAEDYSTDVIYDGLNTSFVEVPLVLLEKGNFGGKVVTALDGEVLVGATVTLKTDDESFLPLYEETNETGDFLFQMIDAGTYNMTIELDGFAIYQENVTVIAMMDNLDTFELDPVEFEVIYYEPPNKEIGFPVNGKIILTFSRALDNESLEEISLIDFDSLDTVPVEYDLSEDMMTVTMTPMDPLNYGTTYRIQVSPYLMDVNGNYLVIPFNSEFNTTGLSIPVTVTHTPATNQADVPVTTKIVITFSVRMDVETVEDGLTVTEDDSDLIDGTLTSSDGRVFTFTPSAMLNYDTRYRVDLANTIMPIDSMYTFNATSFSFTTAEKVTKAVVTGKVLDEDLKAFKPADVIVSLLQNGKVVKTLSPNPNGTYKFTDVAPGAYILRIEVKGYETIEKTINVKLNDNNDQGVKTPDKKEADGDSTIYIIIAAIILVVFLGVVVYLYMKKKEEPLEGEEGAGYGGLRRYGGAGYGGYDEMSEGEFICPNCQSVVGPEEEVCGSCGAEFERDIFECPECGTTIPGDAPKCPQCNADFSHTEEGEEGDEYLDSDEEKVDDVSRDYEVDPIEDEPEYIGMKDE